MHSFSLQPEHRRTPSLIGVGALPSALGMANMQDRFSPFPRVSLIYSFCSSAISRLGRETAIKLRH